MHHNQRGTGPKLLLIHGLGGSWQSWSTIFDALSAHRTVIAVDLPGHGATPVEGDSGTFVGLVGSVERYIAENDLTGVDIVGSSMGARIVLELARRGGVGNVVALDPGGFWRGWERTFFKVTIGLSGRLLRAIRPLLPTLCRYAVTRTALLAQLSVRPWALDPHVVTTELNGTQHHADVRRAGRRSCQRPGADRASRSIHRSRRDRMGQAGSSLPAPPGDACQSGFPIGRFALVRVERPLPRMGHARRDRRGHSCRNSVTSNIDHSKLGAMSCRHPPPAGLSILHASSQLNGFVMMRSYP